MRDTMSPLLQSLVGKTIKSVHVSDAHGDILYLYFTDGSHLSACSTSGLEAEEPSGADTISVNLTDKSGNRHIV